VSKTAEEVKADVNGFMDPLFAFMENEAPKEQRDRFRQMMTSVHRSMKYTLSQLALARITAVGLGLALLYQLAK